MLTNHVTDEMLEYAVRSNAAGRHGLLCSTTAWGMLRLYSAHPPVLMVDKV